MAASDPPGSSQPLPEKRRTPWLRWVLIGCGGLVVLAVIFIISLIFVVNKATAAPELVVTTFLAEAATGDTGAAHEHFSAPLKEVQPLDQFAASVEANRHLFDVSDTSFSERSVDMQGAKLAGTVTLASGTEVPCSFELVRKNDQWKLISYNIGSGE